MDVRSAEKFKRAGKCLMQLNLRYSSIYSIINIQESLDIDTLEHLVKCGYFDLI